MTYCHPRKAIYRILGGPPLCTIPREVEFHVRHNVRVKYDLEDSLFSSSGNVIFADFHAAQLFSDRLNSDRPDHVKISSADLNAAALLDEMFHYAIARYRDAVEPDVIERTLAEMIEELGAETVDRMLLTFLDLFPTTEVFRSTVEPKEYLDRTTGGIANRALLLEEMLVSRICNENPAFSPVAEIIGDEELRADPHYGEITKAFSRPPGKKLDDRQVETSLVDLLREPARRVPYSLTGQLAFVLGEWRLRIAQFLEDRLVLASGLLAEERHGVELRGFTGGPGPAEAPTFVGEPEEENFSPDVDWMPRVIMVAKNALVWLDQLSKKYNRPIRRLDEVPEEEIVRLARWGFNALWLIGVWQRSEASRKLKQRTGNPDAAPSAYSLFDYVISEELGGEYAVRKFSETCRRHGIRLASDMVPNHTGIDSRWIREHPDWFIQLPYPPYPSYRYTSETIGESDAPILQVEDGYFDRSDAAVTFRWQDRKTGTERFIYHGNDGTGMPWNDTAQLDFARADVREAVTQTILYVARMFSIIRFDAAMVLTKKHFHRLWYPEPGSGDGVPSRAAHGMKRATFDQRMPNEFWREVVDRVAVEVPDTLLLAEAFWLLEGYFVRTLGMHRVYNSAFMHMLKKEDNAEYRDVIKNTVAFDPEILKRYVNFMSNPDEETAIEQFGDGDKYFGVCVLMCTLPGLPMFGHGQVEGLREKYGMEYKRAYLDESPRDDLIARHERELVPLSAKRYLFAEVKHFHLLDFLSDSGGVNENVLTFTNGTDGERAVVVYNNRFESARGRILSEALHPDQSGPGVSISAALDLHPGPDDVITYRDLLSSREYVETSAKLQSQGLTVRLRGYEYRVLTGFQARSDDEERAYTQLAETLNGAGVEDLEVALSEMHLKPVVEILAPIAHAALSGQPEPETDSNALSAGRRVGLADDGFREALGDAYSFLAELVELSQIGDQFPWKRSSRYRAALELISTSLAHNAPVRAALAARKLLQSLAEISEDHGAGIVAGVLVELGYGGRKESATLVEIGLGLGDLKEVKAGARRPILRFAAMTESRSIRDALNVHEFAGTTYFNKERLEIFAAAAFCEAAVEIQKGGKTSTAKAVANHYDAYKQLIRVMEESQYDWNSFTRRIRRVRRSKKSSSLTIKHGKTNT